MNKLFLLLSTLILTFACTKKVEKEVIIETDGPDMTKAIATVSPIGDSGVSGTVTFTKADEGVLVEANIEGLDAGEHGFHIHEYGDCTATDGTSAGGHFNPADQEHSSPESENRHMGDMGNLVSTGPDQITTYSYTDQEILLPMIAGRGIIIHAGQDDMSSQPSGAAGSRLACGVIGVAN